jgi:hypothetical protein
VDVTTKRRIKIRIRIKIKTSRSRPEAVSGGAETDPTAAT